MTRRNHREHLRSVPVDYPHELEVGRFRKTDAHDCGRPRCGICHGDKRFGHEETRQELISELELEEFLEEVEDRHD